MIDIMLVLLIIFMIVTPLIANGFQAAMPNGDNLQKRHEGDNEILLGIDKSGSFFLNGEEIDPAALETRLVAIYQARSSDKFLYFRADKGLKIGKIQEAVEMARKAGVVVMSSVVEM